MEKSINVYYAVNRKGRGVVFTDCPVRNEKWGLWEGSQEAFINEVIWLFESEGFTLPDLKWSDEPVALEISVRL